MNLLKGEGSRSCVVTSPDLARSLWEDGHFGASTRSSRYMAEFIAPPQPSSRSRAASARKRGKTLSSSEGEDSSKPVEETVQVNILEAKYLNETRNLPVLDTSGAHLTGNTLASTFDNGRLSLGERYSSYKRLREAGFVPKTGTQYGADYVLYKGDPNVHHSKYCVMIEKEDKPSSIRSVLAHMRVAEQTRKLLVLTDPTSSSQGNEGKIEGIVLKRWVCKHEIASDSKPVKAKKDR